MREIKFRAKISGTDIWLYDFGFHFTDLSVVFLGESQLEKLDEDIADMYGDNGGDVTYFEVETIDQFTGLLDKNGKEIYEGDILVDTRKDTGKEPQEVRWYRGGFMLQTKGHFGFHDIERYDGDSKYFEIIGNIHENPELLEGIGKKQ